MKKGNIVPNTVLFPTNMSVMKEKTKWQEVQVLLDH